jgi:cytochrome b pre-mRNA-processing protein 3
MGVSRSSRKRRHMLSLFRKPSPPPQASLYARVVEAARQPAWYISGAVPDTLDGRFDMLALVTALLVLRLQADPDPHARQAEADLADRFAADIEGNFREMGVGDLSITKEVGKAMGALEGRLAAYRTALADTDSAALEAALVRNLWRGEPPGEDARAWTAGQVRALGAALAATPLDRLLAGDWAQ